MTRCNHGEAQRLVDIWHHTGACMEEKMHGPVEWGECLYCGEAVRLPAKYCCLEHEEGRSME